MATAASGFAHCDGVFSGVKAACGRHGGGGADGGGAMFRSWMGISSFMTMAMLVWNSVRSYLPRWRLPFGLGRRYSRCLRRFTAIFDPYISIVFSEYDDDKFKCSELFREVQAYLSASAADTARRLKAETAKDSDRLLLTMGHREEVFDKYGDVAVVWSMVSKAPTTTSIPPWYRVSHEERRHIYLLFHERHRDVIVDRFLPHVRREGRAVMLRNRRRKLFSNWDVGLKKGWTHVPFDHPSTFDTLAMHPEKKKEIIDDLDAFRQGKEFYKRIGKAWKRGYLLYGPPGTGKSTMIAAMANYLDYDIYDLELTSVETNTELRKLFIETSGRSIIVIEDIDCSLDLTGKRKKKGKKKPADPLTTDAEKESKVTLSGLLNFIDGLWSACGEERLLVFTTNYFEKLDAALVRRGRMDKHIEMSFCCFEAFKFLAKKYLDADDDERHPLFAEVRELLERVKMTPADVAENLMPKCAGDDAESCLRRLITALVSKQKDGAKVEEEEEAMIEEEDKDAMEKQENEAAEPVKMVGNGVGKSKGKVVEHA